MHWLRKMTAIDFAMVALPVFGVAIVGAAAVTEFVEGRPLAGAMLAVIDAIFAAVVWQAARTVFAEAPAVPPVLPTSPVADLAEQVNRLADGVDDLREQLHVGLRTATVVLTEQMKQPLTLAPTPAGAARIARVSYRRLVSGEGYSNEAVEATVDVNEGTPEGALAIAEAFVNKRLEQVADIQQLRDEMWKLQTEISQLTADKVRHADALEAVKTILAKNGVDVDRLNLPY